MNKGAGRAKANFLKLNVNKTNIVRFFLGSVQSAEPANNTITKYSINAINEVKCLGVQIDSKLTWSNNVDSLVAKLKSAAYAKITIRVEV